MPDFPPAWPHGPLAEVFTDLFTVTGTMRGEFCGAIWQFSRNMTVLRQGNRLCIVDAVRLDDYGLAALDALGTVVDVVRLGDMHGIDDRFYVDRYDARFWCLPGMRLRDGLTPDRELQVGGEMPIAGCGLFRFETSKRPEGILHLERDGGILIACDALQNWPAPDAYFSPETAERMRAMGFFRPAGVGPLWLRENEPEASDFARLSQVPFRHLFCGHGVALRDRAQQAFRATFHELFGV